MLGVSFCEKKQADGAGVVGSGQVMHVYVFWTSFLWVEEKPSNIFEQEKVSVPR